MASAEVIAARIALPVRAFQIAAAAAEHDAPAGRHGVVGQGRVALGAPVAQDVAGAGRDHQDGAAIVFPLRPRPCMRVVRHRQVPEDAIAHQPQRFAEAADRIQHVDAGAVGDARVDEQAVAFLAARPVVANAQPRRDERGQQVGARRYLQLQQDVEALPEFAAQRTHAGQPGLLVVLDEAHARQASQQPVFALADDPRDRDIGPCTAQCVQQRQHMGDIAERGQAQQAE
jgi:hypothetical protein